MAATTMRLKLLIDRKGHRVLFAEAGKDFVDFLFSILSLPIGTVVRLLEKANMVGGLGCLYESIENLNETYMQPNQNKDSLLNPKAPAGVSLLLPNVKSPTAREVYMCTYTGYTQCHYNYADDARSICPTCENTMSNKGTYVAPPGAKNDMTTSGEGYVKEVVTYMVMDDLVVQPLSTISSITLLNKCNVKDVAVLEERVIDFGMDEGVQLLKASLQSKTVLTNVFLGKEEA